MDSTEVRELIDRLDEVVGVKERIAEAGLRPSFEKQDYAALCQLIGAQLGLKNSVSIAHTTATRRFTTSALSRTDAWGHGTQGVSAQVLIPSNLPIYGTGAFDAHVVEMLVGDDFRSLSFYTAVSLLAHELSHMLLHGLRHPDRDSEKATDLAPLLLGFADVARLGRTIRVSERRSNGTYIRTTTFGYLSDDEFESAVDEVDRILTSRRETVRMLQGRARNLFDQARTLLRLDTERRAMLRDLDATRRRVRPRDGERIVGMHAPGFGDDARAICQQCEALARQAESLATSRGHFSRAAAGIAAESRKQCAGASRRLKAALDEAVGDLRVLRRNQPLKTRLMAFIRRRVRGSKPMATSSSS